MATDSKEAQQVILDRILKEIGDLPAQVILDLAEAWAWLVAPAQPHGQRSAK